MAPIHRYGGFLVLVDTTGRRHAIRIGALTGLSDADDAQSETVVQLPGGRFVIVAAPLEDILAAVGPGGSPFSG